MTPEMVAEVLPRLGLTREKLFVDLGSGLCFIRDQWQQCNSAMFQGTAG